MKRILFSLMTVVVLGGLGFGVTRAFFSDSEKSVGNKFTAGSLDLQIDSTSHYDGMVCTNGVWVEESLGSSRRPDLLGTVCTGSWPAGSLVSKKFFDLSDLKPGDDGENTISFHVTNESWACVRVDNLTTGVSGPELSQQLFFTSWGDVNCDNKFNGTEQLLFTNKKGPASDVLNGKTYTLADSSTGNPLPKNVVSCLGLQWCAGTMTIDEVNHTILCDGASMGNDAQGDTVNADIAFYAEQSRNNPTFQCSQHTF